MADNRDWNAGYRRGFADAANMAVEAVWDSHSIRELQTWREKANAWAGRNSVGNTPSVVRTLPPEGSAESRAEELGEIERRLRDIAHWVREIKKMYEAKTTTEEAK